MPTAEQNEFQALATNLSGRVSTAQDADWDSARQAFNLTADQRPAAVVHAADARDVSTAVRFAGEHDLRVAPQVTGHGAVGLELDGTLLLKTTEIKGVEIDAGARRARVGSGTTWVEVLEPAAADGLAALHGSSGTVGVAGYTLGGGLGWYGRKHGLQANSVTAIELVGAEGEEIRVDHQTEPELFWALRGGGGNFGVVTAIEFDLIPVSDVYAGMFLFPWERSAEVLQAWNELLPTPARGAQLARLASSRSPTCLRSLSWSAEASSPASRRPFWAPRTRARSCSSRCARSDPTSTPSAWCLRPRSPSCTWTRPSRFPA